jgi:preprotein translocase subunit SecF
MQLFSRVPNYDFMGQRRMAIAISLVLILGSVFSLVTRGLNFGIDFTGGVLLEVHYEPPVGLEEVRAVLTQEGYEGAMVQTFGTPSDVLIRLPPAEEAAEGAALGNELLMTLRRHHDGVDLRRTEFVGPQVGEDLTEQGGLAMLFALIMIFGYIMVRFQWKFAAGSIAALVHDVIITFGFFSMTGITFDLNVVAAVLAVIGYSLNDTIVIYDRIRENFRAIRRGTAEKIINTSVNQTLARTLVTGVTTLMVLFAFLTLGGEAMAGFSIALIVGIIVGTYSSIYVASTAALALDVSPADLIPVKREEVDEMP